MNSYANDLIDIVSALNLSKINVVAHSVSSMISLLAAVKKPQFFSKMVFVGASPRYLNDEAVKYLVGFNQLDLNGMYEAMKTNYYAWVSGFSAMAMGNSENPELGKQFAGTLANIRPDIALSVAKVIFESDYRQELSKFTQETGRLCCEAV